MHKLVKNRILITMILLVTMLLSLVPVVTSAEGNEGDLAQEGPKTEVQNLEDANPENPNPENADPEDANPEDANPENPNPENVDSEAPNQEDNSDTNEELQPFMAPLRGPMSGGSYTLGNGDVFGSLKEAMEAAPDGDTITVTGELTETQAVSVVSDITLIAGGDTAKINFTGDAVLNVDNGNTLTLGSGDAEPVLQITSSEPNVTNSVAVNVTNGHLIFQAGVRLEDKGVALDGSTAQGIFTGGEITIGPSRKPYIAIWVKNGARIDTISGGVYHGSDHALNISGSGSTIEAITGGEFSHRKNKAGNSAVVVKGGGKINTISGGTFTSLTRAGVEVCNGGWIDEISGGTFQYLVDPEDLGYYNYTDHPLYNYFSGLLICAPQPNASVSKTGVGKISGGNFSGTHGLYTVGNVSSPDYGQVTIEEISGGNFQGIKLQGSANVGGGALIGQFTHVKKITGGSFSSNYGPAFYVTVDPSFEEGSPRTEIDEISGGLYQASEANTAMVVQTAHVGLISGGKFFCGDDIAGAKSLDVNSKAQIDKITGGLYWGKINIESGCTSLEPGLNVECGEARYWGHGDLDSRVIGEYHHDPITNEGEHVVYPKYTVDEKTFSYFPSTYSGTVHFWEFEPKDHLNQKEWLLYDKDHKCTGYFKETSGDKEGSFDWSGKDTAQWYADNGYGAKEFIYTLEPAYYEDTFQTSSELSGKKFIYLQRRPALSFVANSPLASAAPTGSAPSTRYIRPYHSNDLGMTIAWEEEYGQWEQVFKVPGNPGNLELAGYKFKGWNTQADGKGLNLREGKYYLMPLKNVTLYAQWEPAGVTITYDPNGGVFRGSTGLTSEAHLIGEEIKIAEAATRSGYKFLYWEGSKYFPGDTYEVVGDHTFTAVWEKETPGLRPSGIRVTNPSNQYFVTISEAPTQKRITNLPATGSHDSYLSALGLLAIGLILILKKR
ncbi:MAG: InlB B-repeat-containing protein [Clostridiales bacterium]|nr:InlB B-repeat-containing protein [Clostridiales bacterium]